MFSISTIASSTRMPVTSVMPSRLTRLSEKPISSMAQKVGIADSGRAIAAISVARQLRRNRKHDEHGEHRALDQRLHRRLVVAMGIGDRVVDRLDRGAAMPPELIRHVARSAGSTSASPATTSGPKRRSPLSACSGPCATSHPSWRLSFRLRSREPDTQSTFVSSPHKGLNNRAENSHQPTRRRERQMKRFKSAGQAQRFLAAHDQINNLFHLRRDHITAVQYRTVRAQAFVIWAEP